MTLAATVLPATSRREWIESFRAAWITVPAGTLAAASSGGAVAGAEAGRRGAAVSKVEGSTM
jgi:hypothetical protein